ncbi:radical SAM protein [Patescibacteria group bacterium]
MVLFNITRTKRKTLTPNILITNFCNQDCKYCFAKEEMKTTNVKEMSFYDFKKLVKVLKTNNVKILRLMGGEPTIHSKFKEILKIAQSNFDQTVIFTNGLIPDKIKDILLKKANIKKINFNFNLDTTAYLNSKKEKREILVLLKKLSKKTKVNIGFTIFTLNRNYKKLFRGISNNIMENIGVRFGLAKNIIGQKPFIKKSEYKNLGEKIIELVIFLKKKNVKDIYIDCGLKKEMFTDSQIKYLLKNTIICGWECNGKWSCFDISSDLSVFPCFPYYNKIKVKLDDFNSFYKIDSYFQNRRKKTCLD